MTTQIFARYTQKYPKDILKGKAGIDRERARIAQRIEGLKLDAVQKYFNEIDPAELVGREIETRVILPTMTMKANYENNEAIYSAIVEIELTPAPVVEFWEDPDFVDDMYDWHCAQSVGVI